MKRTIFYILAFALCSCAVQRATTSEEFVRDVQKDLPFNVSDAIEGMSELSVETLNTLTK